MREELSRHRLVRILLTGVIFALFGAMFVPFFAPLLMAALFGFALEGLVSRFALKRSARRFPTALILLAFFLLISFPVALIGYRVVSVATALAQSNVEGSKMLSSLESLIASLESVAERALRIVGAEPPEGGLMSFLPNVGAIVLSYTAALASQAPQLLIQLFIFSAALYLFLTEASYIRGVVSSFRVIKESELDQIIRVVQRSSYVTLVVSAAVGSVQAMIVALGGVFFGFREFFLLFVITFFTSFIPVVGAAPVALFLALLSLIQGNLFSAAGLTVVAVVAGSVDNIIKPLIVASSSEESVNPIVSLLAIIGGVIVYGLPGLLLGPILTELTLKIVPILFKEDELEEARHSAKPDLPAEDP